jgi:hypothetical protein
LTILNPAVKSILSKQAGKLSAKGVNKDQIIRASDKLLLKKVEEQSLLRFSMDYYEMMSWLLFATLLLILLFPI